VVASPRERVAAVNGIEIAFEVIGERDRPPMLLINGLGGQLLQWDLEFCKLLAAGGFRVIRFDNRDVGHSTKLGASDRYTLEDMAADTIGLLNHLAIDAAHLVGISMGGMIAQTIAIRHPDRVLSLVSIMSTTGNPKVGRPHRRGLIPRWQGPPPSREAYVERVLELARALSSEAYPPDERRLRRQFAAAYDRGYHPAGVLRQMRASATAGDRTRALGGVSVPTLVIHGDADPLVDQSGGRATAAAIPAAELLIIEGMGHTIPRSQWRRIVAAIAANAACGA
jgi:pimeloyl-ACP methyl ester carboxylesterase